MSDTKPFLSGREFAIRLEPWNDVITLPVAYDQKMLNETDENAKFTLKMNDDQRQQVVQMTGQGFYDEIRYQSIFSDNAEHYGVLAEKYPEETALLLRMATTAFIGLCGYFYAYLSKGPMNKRADLEELRRSQVVREGAGASLEDSTWIGTAITQTGSEMNMCMDAIEQYRKVSPDGVDLSILEEELRAMYNWEACRKPSRFSRVIPSVKSPIEATTQDSEKKSSKSGPCFVATAVYGSPMALEVQVLRDYRDSVLVCRGWGRSLVRVYELVGPSLAVMIASKPLAKVFVRRILLSPLIGFIRHFYGVG